MILTKIIKGSTPKSMKEWYKKYIINFQSQIYACEETFKKNLLEILQNMQYTLIVVI